VFFGCKHVRRRRLYVYIIEIIDLRGIVGAPREWVAQGDRISDPRGGFVAKKYCCRVSL